MTSVGAKKVIVFLSVHDPFAVQRRNQLWAVKTMIKTGLKLWVVMSNQGYGGLSRFKY